jgi:hypothetical protein
MEDMKTSLSVEICEFRIPRKDGLVARFPAGMRKKV